MAIMQETLARSHVRRGLEFASSAVVYLGSPVVPEIVTRACLTYLPDGICPKLATSTVRDVTILEFWFFKVKFSDS